MSDPKCPAIPDPCNPPKDTNVQWVLSIPSSGDPDYMQLRFTNFSDQAQEIRGTLYDITGETLFADQTLWSSGTIAAFATVVVKSVDLEKLTLKKKGWTGGWLFQSKKSSIK